jgi:peptidoglycan/LPS O-acetylase OafA/YrhL
MLRKEKGNNGGELALVMRSGGIALLAMLAAMLCLALMMYKGVLGAGEYRLWGKLALAVGALAGSLSVRTSAKQSRLALSLISCVSASALVCGICLLSERGKVRWDDAFLDAVAVLLICLIVSMVASKRTKRRKYSKINK